MIFLLNLQTEMIIITIALKMKSLMQYITDFFLKTFMNLVSPPALGSATYFFIPPFVASPHFPLALKLYLVLTFAHNLV